MSTEKLFLRKWFPIFKAGSRLIIGLPKTSKCIDTEYTEKKHKLLTTLVEHGISVDESIENNFYSEFLNKEMLSKRVQKKRNELFYEYLGIESDIADILTKKILIFGAGAGGSSLCYMLAQSGFRNIHIVDNDIVEESEVQKTLVFRKADVGKLKIDVLKELLSENFNISLTIYKERPSKEFEINNMINLVNPDFIVKACDPNTDFRIFLNRICFRNKIPFINMAYSFETTIIGPLFVPEITCCELSLNEYQKKVFGNNHSFETVEKLFSHHITHPSINFNINTLASIIFKEIVFFLLEKYEYLISLGKIVHFSPLNLRGTTTSLVCLSNCQYKSKK